MASLFRTEAGAQLIARRYQEFLKFWPQPNRQLVNGPRSSSFSRGASRSDVPCDKGAA